MRSPPNLSNYFRLPMVLLSAAWLCTACVQEAQNASTVMPNDFLYYDDFSFDSTRKWHTEADEIGSSSIEEGRMIIAVKSPNTMQYTTMLEPLMENFILEVEATALGPSDEASYGVVFGINELPEFVRFEITMDGRFMIERALADGSWTQYLNDWKRADSILQGVNATNKLRVEVSDDQVLFYVNNDLVYSINDTNLVMGKIGLDLGTFAEPSAAVAFDNLLIREP